MMSSPKDSDYDDQVSSGYEGSIEACAKRWDKIYQKLYPKHKPECKQETYGKYETIYDAVIDCNEKRESFLEIVNSLHDDSREIINQKIAKMEAEYNIVLRDLYELNEKLVCGSTRKLDIILDECSSKLSDCINHAVAIRHYKYDRYK